MFDHVCLRVPASKFTEVVKFYVTILAPLGFKQVMDSPTFAGFGVDKPNFSIISKGETAGNEIHLAFTAESEFIYRFYISLLRG
jgi:catechol 2,3-dioxygenase-like lactoylglutathione lyase family enzyme